MKARHSYGLQLVWGNFYKNIDDAMHLSEFRKTQKAQMTKFELHFKVWLPYDRNSQRPIATNRRRVPDHLLIYDMSCHVMSCHVMSCHVMSCHVMSCHVMSCHVMSCHVMSCHVMSCHVMSCHVMLCYVVLFAFLLSCFLCCLLSCFLLCFPQKQKIPASTIP